MKEVVAAGGGGGVSPCAACKLLRRRCSPGCVFAPYFPAGEPHRFASVHKVFGASNISKLLQEIPAEHRGDAVSSLVYEANARVRDPIYGCVGAITSLQRQVESLQTQLALAQAEMVRLRMANAYGAARRNGGGSSASGSPSSISSPTKATPDHHHHMAAVNRPGVMELELECSRFWSF
ncbi:putative lateral organ boundaries (LOB) domain family [Hordeum vulgare]|nr:LOB domain-containing protein 4-like [Hordeum vulgare subsp. vulgare]XP_044979431.1 LOB domain-containing protein 4-like [Hordeum vulgare subsp. vulgare]KAE8792955.1 putative lateral organ boundaries (LOB) domain family [Hordeum vulgare]